jgi:hypothetical protein
MSEMDDKLIVKLGQRISEQNEILRMIAGSLQGIESHLRQWDEIVVKGSGLSGSTETQ